MHRGIVYPLEKKETGRIIATIDTGSQERLMWTAAATCES